MGRIKSTAIKTLGNDIVKAHGEKFTTDFAKNKKILESVKTITSKRTKNIVAGYITKKTQDMKRASDE
jgi:small subunit ribosomal protein S17e